MDTQNSYYTDAKKTKLLTEEEEKEFIIRYRENNDQHAYNALALGHLRFVLSIAGTFSGYTSIFNISFDDLVQEGNVGLLKAINNYDPASKARLATYAAHWIKSAMREYVIRNARNGRIATTRAQRRLFFKLNGMKKTNRWLNHSEVLDIADKLDVKPDEVREMELRLSAIMEIPFDPPVSSCNDDDYETSTPSATISSGESSVLEALIQSERSLITNQSIYSGLLKLKERDRDIIMSRFIQEKKESLQGLADRYGVSAERIRQLEKNAIGRLNKWLSNESMLTVALEAA